MFSTKLSEASVLKYRLIRLTQQIVGPIRVKAKFGLFIIFVLINLDDVWWMKCAETLICTFLPMKT